VAKENNRGSINSAQKAGRTAKTAPKPRGKPGPKPSTKHKRTEVIAIEDNGKVGDGEAGEPALAPKPRGKPVQSLAQSASRRRLRLRLQAHGS
jgi:hypothetical protein